MIKRAWIRRYTELPLPDDILMVTQSWDTAMKGGPDNDWSVCTTWYQTRDLRWYLIHVWRDRVDYPTLKQKAAELAISWGARQVLIEESGTAVALIAELQSKVMGITAVKPDKDKITRMSIASAQFEAGQVFLPQRAPWLPELEAGLFSFPNGRHDDQVDSISQLLNHPSEVATWLKFAGIK